MHEKCLEKQAKKRCVECGLDPYSGLLVRKRLSPEAKTEEVPRNVFSNLPRDRASYLYGLVKKLERQFDINIDHSISFEERYRKKAKEKFCSLLVWSGGDEGESRNRGRYIREGSNKLV